MSARILNAPTSPREAKTRANSFRSRRSRPKSTIISETTNNQEGPKRKPSPSSLLLSLTFSNATTNKNPFRRLGCLSVPDVHNPSVVHSLARSSAYSDAKKSTTRSPTGMINARRKKKAQIVDSDIWCSPGIPFSTEADSVGCVVSRRPPETVAPPPRRVSGHERSLRSDFKFDMYTENRELSMLQSSLLLGRMSFGDRFRDLRHDIDRMTYEELLELGEKIGHVCTGLNEEQIVRCIRKMKHSGDVASHFSCENERKCNICQAEYEVKDEIGTLQCGHKFHMYCIKQWLLRKNACPFCKSAAYQR